MFDLDYTRNYLLDIIKHIFPFLLIYLQNNIPEYHYND